MAQWVGYDWVFTINAKDWCPEVDDDGTALEYLAVNFKNIQQDLGGRAWNGEDDIEYVICQGEIGKNGTPHLQGFIQFTRSMKRSEVKEILGIPWAHLEKREGTPKQASDYCEKLDTAWKAVWPIYGGEMIPEDRHHKKGMMAYLQRVNTVADVETLEEKRLRWHREADEAYNELNEDPEFREIMRRIFV